MRARASVCGLCVCACLADNERAAVKAAAWQKRRRGLHASATSSALCAQVAIAPRAIGLMGTAFARLHRGDEGGGGGGGGCQELVSLLLLQWLCKPWSAADEVTQRCIVAGITLLERQPDIDTSGMVRAVLCLPLCWCIWVRSGALRPWRRTCS